MNNGLRKINGLRELISDEKGKASTARILSIWGYLIVTFLIVMDLAFGQDIEGATTLYTWLIGASAAGKTIGKYIEAKRFLGIDGK